MEAPFRMLELEEMEAILFSANCKALKDVQSVDGNYHMYSHKTDLLEEREFLIFQYYVPDDEDGILPDNIWSRIFVGPAFGEGTQVLQHGLLTFPLIVINEHNGNSIVEIVNDGAVAFEVNGDKELAKKVYLWMKQNTIEHVFRALGERIIGKYTEQIIGGEAAKYLINADKL